MPDNICDTCCREIPANAPGGLCPACLLRAGINQDADVAEQKTTPFPAALQPVPSAADLAPFFPQLEILSLIGQGGMGAVYHARQLKLDRPIALKIIRPEAAMDPSFAERFAREARTLARLNHPGIVGIHDFGEFEQGYFFLMEYVAGANLRQVLREGKLEQSQALSIVRQICEALQYAHDQGVVHRDIKPENILVDQSGQIRIADFGLARLNLTEDGRAAENAENYFTLTGTHQVMGTPRYMAPEQIEASSGVDHRADIYSLGVVFYEMLTGEVPMGSFEAPSKKESVDNRLDNVVLKAMAREPERRYQQISSLANDVNAISDPGTVDTSRYAASRTDSGENTPTTSMAGADGFSVILNRDAKAFVPWVTSAFIAEEEAPKRPPVLMILGCCIAGIIASLFSWAKIGTEAFGSDTWFGIVGGCMVISCLCIAGIVLTLVPVKKIMPSGLAVALGILSFVSFIGIMIFTIATLTTSEAGFTPAYYVSLVSIIAVFATGIVGLRHWIVDARNRASELAENRGTSQIPDSSLFVGPDWVVISNDDILSGKLPNMCMVCGEESTGCVSRTFEWQPKFLEELQRNWKTASIAKRRFRVPCPTCTKHRGHWTKFILFCSLGWIAPIVSGGIGTAIVEQFGSDKGWFGVVLPVMFFVPMACYIGGIIYLAHKQIRVVRIENDSITLDRVSPRFAKLFRDSQSA